MARGRGQYNAYRGRRPWGRRVLLGILIVLVVVLILAVAAFLLLRDSIIYTDQGIVLPFFQSQTSAPSAEPAQEAGTDGTDPDEELVVESPSPSPSPTPTPAPTLDLSAFSRREIPLELVTVGLDAVLDGTAKESLEDDRGVIVDMTDEDLEDLPDGLTEALRELPYTAAYLDPDWNDPDWEDLTARCAALAGLGYDEVVLSSCVPQGDGKDLAEGYRAIRKALDDAGWKGRLSTVVRRSYFTEPDEVERVLPAVAANFDRVYAAKEDSWSGLNIYAVLTSDEMGFVGTTADVVTVVDAPVNANWSWAVLE